MYITILDYATGETVVKYLPSLHDDDDIERYIEEELKYKITEIAYMASKELSLHVLIDKEKDV